MDVKEIRKTLKAKLNYNARMVSVSQRHSKIVFTIRNEEVDYKKVKEFSINFEDVSYDQATQCILRGGNTFIQVDFSDAVRESLTNKFLPAVEAAISKIDDSCIETVEGTNYMVGTSQYGGFSLWSKKDDCGSFVVDCYSPKVVAFNIAIGR